MQTLPLRLMPHQDLRGALEAALAGTGCSAAFVLSGIGSLSQASLRLAGAEAALALDGDFEILSLAGTVATNGCHLHAALAGPTVPSSAATWLVAAPSGPPPRCCSRCCRTGGSAGSPTRKPVTTNW